VLRGRRIKRLPGTARSFPKGLAAPGPSFRPVTSARHHDHTADHRRVVRPNYLWRFMIAVAVAGDDDAVRSAVDNDDNDLGGPRPRGGRTGSGENQPPLSAWLARGPERTAWPVPVPQRGSTHRRQRYSGWRCNARSVGPDSDAIHRPPCEVMRLETSRSALERQRFKGRFDGRHRRHHDAFLAPMAQQNCSGGFIATAGAGLSSRHQSYRLSSSSRRRRATASRRRSASAAWRSRRPRQK
jgi:hypothetical protein